MDKMSTKPKLLDACCGAGGCSMGYHRAGFDVVGVDIEPQPNYPFEFHQGDALEFIEAHWREFDVISISVPCQPFTRLAAVWRAVAGYSYDEKHNDIVQPARDILKSTGKPYIIENVVGAPLENPFMLCGAMFGLKVYRHRIFESNLFFLTPPHVPHKDKTPAVGRGVSPKGFISVTGNGGFGIPDGFQYAKNAMGIDWMSRTELSQAIPPAYTEWIGHRLLETI